MRWRLVDRILEIEDGGRIRGVKTVAMSEDVLEHHFPNNPIFPGVLLLEALVQLAGWQVAVSSELTQWFLLDRVDRCGFYAPCRPGDQIELTVDPVAISEPDRAAFRGVGRVDGGKRVAAELSGCLVALDELEDPASARRQLELLLRADER
jgi:3-hydroxyacyl-[acyl-carrier-protein] dehydratase